MIDFLACLLVTYITEISGKINRKLWWSNSVELFEENTHERISIITNLAFFL